MDRFIALILIDMPLRFRNLKSNMDRFIVANIVIADYNGTDLKSNMDRFIAFVSEVKKLGSKI